MTQVLSLPHHIREHFKGILFLLYACYKSKANEYLKANLGFAGSYNEILCA